MARPLRIEYSGAIYHVTVRGNARQKIFLDDRDRRALCARLAESVKAYGVRLYLYCLMDNHFHLVLETPRANLQRFMQSVLTAYGRMLVLTGQSDGRAGRWYEAFVEKGLKDPDEAFRMERGLLPAESVATRVAALWELKAEELKTRRYRWAGKGVAALMLEKYAGLTRRACAPWIGMTSGMGVGYQIRQALSRLKRDPALKRQVDKLEAIFDKESGS